MDEYGAGALRGLNRYVEKTVSFDLRVVAIFAIHPRFLFEPSFICESSEGLRF
jgi:hypothetical protein